jgi:hypothetical protein
MTNLGATWTWQTGDLNTTTSHGFVANFGTFRLQWLVQPFGFTTTNLQISEFGVYGSGWSVNATIRKDVPKNAELACAFRLDWNREAHRGYVVAQVVMDGEVWGEVEVQLPGRIGSGTSFGRPALPHCIGIAAMGLGFTSLGTLGSATAMQPSGWRSFAIDTHNYSVVPPIGGQPARLSNGADVVLRPTRDLVYVESKAGVYVRRGPAEAWGLVATRTISDADASVASQGGTATYLPHHAHEFRAAEYDPQDLIGIGGRHALLDLDGTIDATTAQPTPRSDRYVPASILWDRHSGFWWWVAYCRDDLVVMTNQALFGDATVAVAAVRGASDADMTPHPWIRSRFDAMLEVGVCVGNYIRTWRSSPDWQTWTLDRDDDLGSAARLEAVNHCVGRSGVEAIVGYHAGDGCFYLFQHRHLGLPGRAVRHGDA